MAAYGYSSFRDVVRCAAYTSAGRRCKRRTSKTPYCYQHLEKEEHLVIKPSTIPAAGLGLFTTVPRNPGKITNYAPANTTYTHEDEARGHLTRGHYVLELPTRPPSFSNPFKTTDSAGRYANMARRRDRKTNNSGIGYSYAHHQPFIKAMRRIPNATKQRPKEILATYGREYWPQ